MKKTILFAACAAAICSIMSCGGMMGVPVVTTDSSTGQTTVGTVGATDVLAAVLGGTQGTTTTGTTGSTQTVTDAANSILGNLLGGLLSNTITEKSFVGTWTYQSPEVRFESESILAQAGGAVAANSIKTKIDGYLSKIGITKGATAFTFQEDKTFIISSGNKAIATGTWSYDKTNKILNMQSTFGLMNQSCIVGMDGTNLCLLYDADKLFTALTSAGSILGKISGTLGSITSVLGQNYNGMKIGYSLSK